MNFRIKCHPVPCTKEVLFEYFDQQLFEFITAGFPKTRVLRFDGCRKGDQIHIQLNLLIVKSTWISHVTEDGVLPHEIYFVDMGEKMPFGLTYWKHVHHIIAENGKSYVIEDITYKTGLLLIDWLYYLPFYLQFLKRKRIYRKYINTQQKT